MNRTPTTLTLYLIQEQDRVGGWISTGVSYKDERAARTHVHRLQATALVKDLKDLQFEQLFKVFDRPSTGREFAELEDEKLKVVFLMEQELMSPGFLLYGAVWLGDVTSGWYSYEDCEISL